MNPPRSFTARVLLAFAAIYIIWGSTYLAIRFAVETLPPFLMSGVRFLIAGALLYAVIRPREVRPSLIHWGNAAVIGGLLLLGGNGGVAWAEQTVPSGVAALVIALVPLWMVLIDGLRPQGRLPRGLVFVGVVLGFGGMVLLIDPWGRGVAPVDRVGALVLVLATLSWSFGSVYAQHARLPKNPFLTTAMEMMAGGALLVVVGLGLGEWHGFTFEAVSLRSALALLYLIVFGSIVAFTAYIWLLHNVSVARVSTYAYVNPVIAVFLGWLLADEPLTPRTAVASVVIVLAVALITTSRRQSRRDPESQNMQDSNRIPKSQMASSQGRGSVVGQRCRAGD